MPARGDRKAQLQSIGWLAGNLARDQVGAIVAQVSTPAPVSLAAVEAEPSARAEVPPPAPAPPPATDPPPFAGNATRETAGASGGRRLDADRRRRRRLRVVPDARGWTIGVVSGRPRPTGLARSGRLVPGASAPGFAERSDGLILGAALDVGPDMALAGVRGGSIDFMGVAVLLGGGRRFGRLFVEATGGFGPGGVSIDGHRAKPILVGPRRYRKPKFLHVRPRALPPGTSDRRAGAVEVLRPDGERRRTSRHRGPTGRLPDQLARGEVSLLVTAARRERALSCHGATHESFTLGRPNGNARSTRAHRRDRAR